MLDWSSSYMRPSPGVCNDLTRSKTFVHLLCKITQTNEAEASFVFIIFMASPECQIDKPWECHVI